MERLERFQVLLETIFFPSLQNRLPHGRGRLRHFAAEIFLIVRSSINFEVRPSTVADGSNKLVMPRGMMNISVAG
jgi:hypothetical protein